MMMGALENANAPRLPQRYRLIEPRGGPGSLGEGAYGVVYKALDTETNEMVALKKIRLETEMDGISSSTLREITLLMQLNHENVVRLQNVSLERERMSLVFELLELDLRKYLDRETGPLSLECVQSFTAQLLSGLAYCHSMGVMHRDLKPHNILLSQRPNQPIKLKIADFGLARSFTPFSRPLTMEVITRWYRAPEIILGHNRYTCAVDIWSIGCIIAEISNKRALFMGDCDIDQLYKIFRCLGTPTNETWPGVEELPYYRNNFPEWPAPLKLDHIVPELNEAGVNLLSALFRYCPKTRITAKDALRHPFVVSFVKEEDLLDPYQAAMLQTPTNSVRMGSTSILNSRSNSSSSSSAATSTMFRSASSMASAAPPVNHHVILPKAMHNANTITTTRLRTGRLDSPEDTEVARFMPNVAPAMSKTFLPIDDEEEGNNNNRPTEQKIRPPSKLQEKIVFPPPLPPVQVQTSSSSMLHREPSTSSTAHVNNNTTAVIPASDAREEKDTNEVVDLPQVPPAKKSRARMRASLPLNTAQEDSKARSHQATTTGAYAQKDQQNPRQPFRTSTRLVAAAAAQAPVETALPLAPPAAAPAPVEPTVPAPELRRSGRKRKSSE